MIEAEQILADHQAIIDAWYAGWLAKVMAHANTVWARHRAQSEDASRKRVD